MMGYLDGHGSPSAWLSVVIFINDHDPPHVHVFGQGAEAKVSLDPVALVWSGGFKKSDLKRILEEVQAQRKLLIEKWNEITC